MRIVTNEAYVVKRKSWGNRITLISFLLFIVGAVVSLLDPAMLQDAVGLPTWANLVVSYVLIILGFVGFNVGAYRIRRWGRPDREDLVLKQNLTGLDNRYRLYNYVPGLPVMHTLLTPHAVYVLETRGMDGQTIICQGDNWRRRMGFKDYLRILSEERLKNPTQDALDGMTRLRAYLDEHLPDADVPVEPVVVFTGEVELSVTGPAVPVVLAKNLKGVIRTSADPLLPEVYRAVAQHFIDAAGDLEEDAVAPTSKAHKPSSRRRRKRRKR